MGMGLDTLGTAAGTGGALENLLAQRRAEQLMGQQGLMSLLQMASLSENRQAMQSDREQRLQLAKDKAASDAEEKRAKTAEAVNKSVQALSPGQLIPVERYRELESKGGEAFPKDTFGYQPPSMGMSTPEGEQGPTPEAFKYGGNFTQLSKLREIGGKEDMAAAMQEVRKQLADAATARAEAAANKQPPNSYQLQPEIDPTTGKQTGRFKGFNTKTNSWEDVKGDGPTATKPAPGAGQVANEKRTTDDALNTLRQLDTAIDQAKDRIGPGEGRISSIEQMIGDADPSIQRLGVKMKAAKMRVDHAITGSVRAGASPFLLKQWDNILANNITPEGLKSGVQALREILTGDDSAGGGGIPSVGSLFNGKRVLKVEKVQ